MDRYVFIAATLILTAYAQLIVKSSALRHAQVEPGGRLAYLIAMYSDWRVLSGFACGVIASITWSLALERLPLSHAYPFMALSFVLVPLSAMLIFGEPFRPVQLAGMACIVVGVMLIAITG